MVEAGVEALKHGSRVAHDRLDGHGKPELIAEASKEFLRMLSRSPSRRSATSGPRATTRTRSDREQHADGSLPAFATAGHASSGGAGARTGVAIGRASEALRSSALPRWG